MEQNIQHFVSGTENQVSMIDIWQEKGYKSPDCVDDSDEEKDTRIARLIANGEADQ